MHVRVRANPPPTCLTLSSVVVFYYCYRFYRTLDGFGTVGCLSYSLSICFTLIVLQGIRLLSTYGRIYLKNALGVFDHPSCDETEGAGTILVALCA